jgi:threonine synthase
VPSGNFGDLMGGLLAFHSGLPVARFVVATNANDEVPRFLETGRYEKIVPSRKCISNAMNVGHPSNLARVVDLYGGRMDEQGTIHEPPDLARMQADLFGVSIDDERTRATIVAAHRDHGALLEPHGAVGWAGLQHCLEREPVLRRKTAISLETAHPAKFPEEIRALLAIDPPVPPSLQGLDERQEHYTELETDYRAFKDFLVRAYR